MKLIEVLNDKRLAWPLVQGEQYLLDGRVTCGGDCFSDWEFDMTSH